jgi:hypothetical protein
MFGGGAAVHEIVWRIVIGAAAILGLVPHDYRLRAVVGVISLAGLFGLSLTFDRALRSWFELAVRPNWEEYGVQAGLSLLYLAVFFVWRAWRRKAG